MKLAYQTAEDHPLLAALGLSTGRLLRANLDVHAGDEMLQHYRNLRGDDRHQALVLYFDSGLRIWETMAKVLRWRFGRPGPELRLLDFASGYGRVTRFAVLDLPPERIWVADVYAEGVRFQEEAFGVHGLVSHADPERFAVDGPFDSILVSSLFSHLPAETFRSWLRRLLGLLQPGGILVFSVHGADLLPAGRQMPPAGILFDPESESVSLPGEQYGTSWVDESFVRRLLDEVAPGSSARVFRRGLLSFQDLWVVVPEPGCDFSGLRLGGNLDSFLEHCSATAGRLRMTGWLADRLRGAPPCELRVSIGSEIVQVVRELHPRQDAGALFPYEQVAVHGWSFDGALPAGAVEENVELSLDAVDAAGEVHRIYRSDLMGALLRSARLDLHLARVHGERLAHDLADERTQNGWLRWDLHVLQARLAAMEASRFWKLRNAWFRVKRSLGWTEER